MDEAQGDGWLTFSAVILVFAGLMKIFDSIWAFRTKGQLDGLSSTHATLGSTISHYGWYWLILGVILILAGFAVIGRSQLGRWIGIIAAAVAAIASMAWMPSTRSGRSRTSSLPSWSFTGSQPTAGSKFPRELPHGRRSAFAFYASGSEDGRFTRWSHAIHGVSQAN